MLHTCHHCTALKAPNRDAALWLEEAAEPRSLDHRLTACSLSGGRIRTSKDVRDQHP